VAVQAGTAYTAGVRTGRTCSQQISATSGLVKAKVPVGDITKLNGAFTAQVPEYA